MIQDCVNELLFLSRLKLVAKNSIPKGGEFTKNGKMGMSIRIGGYWEGVCLRSIYMPIKSIEHLTKVIDSYRYAEQRAPQVQQLLWPI